MSLRTVIFCHRFKAVFFAAILLTISTTAPASWDASVGADSESYPIPAAEISVDVGYSFVIWEKEHDLLSPDGYRYGFIRPTVNAASSITSNAINLALDIVPISFLSFEVGEKWDGSSANYDNVDCGRFNCIGSIWSFYFEGEANYRLARLAGAVRFRHNALSSSNGTRPIIDPVTVLALRPGYEQQNTYSTDFLWRWSNHYYSFLNISETQNQGLQGESKFATTGLLYENSKLTLAAGGGAFRSDLKHLAPTFFVQATWWFLPNLGRRQEYAPGTGQGIAATP